MYEEAPDTDSVGRGCAGGRGSAAAFILAAIAVADEQQDHNDEQQPTAVRITAEQVSQTHTQVLLSPL